MTAAKQDLILILDFASQYSQRVARKIRECGVYCEIADYDAGAETVLAKKPQGIILAGSFAGMYKDKNPQFDLKILETNIPTAAMLLDAPAQAGCLELDKLGVKFAAEQITTEAGAEFLRDFLFKTCVCQGNWQMKSFAAHMTEAIRAQAGDKKVLCALSGGIDSAVTAVLTHRAIGDKLTCVFVNHGFLRKGEAEQVIKTFRDEFSMNLVYVDAAERFLAKVAGVNDPEQKRKIIGAEFIRVFEAEAAKLNDIEFLAQGTIYPDIIESGTKAAAVVKSHHNVGGLPEDMKFKLVEPLKELFKDEVRVLAAELKLPEDIIWRQPFPGPGLAVRVIGAITKERLDILRDADAIVQEEIKKAGLYRQIWQAFAILPDMKSVGVTRDKRTYAYTVGLRAVNSDDAMAAEWVRLPYEVLESISSRIVNEVREVNRVVYDITSKPPATIEWE